MSNVIVVILATKVICIIICFKCLFQWNQGDVAQFKYLKRRNVSSVTHEQTHAFSKTKLINDLREEIFYNYSHKHLRATLDDLIINLLPSLQSIDLNHNIENSNSSNNYNEQTQYGGCDISDNFNRWSQQ